jgi:rhodanese-related sulfurtransferase
MDDELSATELAARLEREDDIQLVDVRMPYEHEAGRLADDVLIPLAELSERAGEIDRHRAVVFYCRTGARSAMATMAFRRAGYDALNLAGGLRDWVAHELPIVPEDGHVAD